MKREVTVLDGRVIVRPRADDAVANVRALNLGKRIAAGGRLTDAERDLVLVALLQRVGPA